MAGCGLLAYGAIDRSPGPAWLGVANLPCSCSSPGASEDTLYWWPLLLILLGAVGMAAGLRPRQRSRPSRSPTGRRHAPRAIGDDELVFECATTRRPR